MKTAPVREAKASLSALLEAAEQGHPTLITRHGKPSAMLVSVEAGRQLYPEPEVNLIDCLLAAPERLATRRNTRPLRDMDL